MPKRSRPILQVCVLALVAACSSKNPDALNAVNLDDNYAASEANFAENVDAAAAAPAAPPVAQSSANEAVSSSQENIDAAVNSLRDVEAEDNEVQQAEDQFNRENDDSDQN